MDNLDKKILRRLWLNQILSWCIRGSIKDVKYSREQMLIFIETDLAVGKDIINTIPEASVLFQMFKADKSIEKIEVYIRQAL